METIKEDLKVLVDGDDLYRIPQFQRDFQWDEENWFTLWQDLGIVYKTQLSRQEDEHIPIRPKHFFGVVLREQIPNVAGGEQVTWSLVDGQQRLTSVVLLRAAIHDAMRERAHQEGEDFVLSHPSKAWREKPNGEKEKIGERLELQKGSAESYAKAMGGSWREWYASVSRLPQFSQSRCLLAYTFFRKLIWMGDLSFDVDAKPRISKYSPKQRRLEISAEDLWANDPEAAQGNPINLSLLDTTLMKQFFVLAVTIQPGDQDPSTIYEGMNSKGEELQQWDFARNSMFLQLKKEDAEHLFNERWEPIDAWLSKIHFYGLRGNPRDQFLYDFIIANGEFGRQGSISKTRVFQHLRRMVRSDVDDDNYQNNLYEFLDKRLLRSAEIWGNFITDVYNLPGIGDLSQRVAQTIESIGKLSKSPSAPFVLNLLVAYCDEKITEGQLYEGLRIFETYLARLVVCQENLSPLRARVMSIMGSIDRKNLPQEILNIFAAGNFVPGNDVVKKAICDLDFYGKDSSVTGPQLGSIFRGLERELSHPAHPMKYGNEQDDFTVEHIFPQSCSENLNAAWKDGFSWGENAAEKKAAIVEAQKHLEKFGNLTLITMKANNKIKAKSFGVKRLVFLNQDPNIPHPHLAVSQTITEYQRWTAQEINERSEFFVSVFKRRWPVPEINQTVDELNL